MEIKEFKLVEMSSYSPEQGYKKWYEFQPQYCDTGITYINLGEINKNVNRADNA